jgi:hypothetical protein
VAASFQASAGHSHAGEDGMGQVREESVCVKGRQTDDLKSRIQSKQGRSGITIRDARGKWPNDMHDSINPE